MVGRHDATSGEVIQVARLGFTVSCVLHRCPTEASMNKITVLGSSKTKKKQSLLQKVAAFTHI